MNIEDRNWMQVEEYLQHEDRIVVPLGSIEQHAYLSLGVDRILSERVAIEAAEPLGVLVLPSLRPASSSSTSTSPSSRSSTPRSAGSS